MANGGMGRPQPRAVYVRDPAEALAHVGQVAAELDELDPLLHRLAEITMEATEADRVSFFLVDEATARLQLWATATIRPPEEAGPMWDVGRALPGIPLDAERRRLLEHGEPFGIEDAAQSPLVPREWAETFQLASLVAAPLRFRGTTLGLLVVDYWVHRPLPPDLVALVGNVASFSALAVGNAGLARALEGRAESLHALMEVTSTLISPRSLTDVAECVADAIADVMGGQWLSLHVLEPDGRYRTLAQRGVHFPGHGDVRAFPRTALARVTRAWRHSPRPVVLEDLEPPTRSRYGVPDEVGSALILPLVRPNGDLFGFLLVGCDRERAPSTETVELASAIAAHVAFAVDRAELDEQVAIAAQLAQTLLAADEVDEGSPETVLTALRRAVPRAIGFEVVNVWLYGHSGPRPRFAAPLERRLWERWRRRRTRPEVVEDGGVAYAPVWAHGRALGLLQARPLALALAPNQRELLELLATTLGEVVHRRHLREQMAERDRQLAISEERAALAAELHAAVGHVLAVIARAADELSARPAPNGQQAHSIGALARAGLDSLSEALGNLGSVRYEPPGFEATLGGIVSRLGSNLGMAADIEIRGEHRPLSVGVEQALVRVVHEAVARVGEGGRASAIAVRLDFTPDTVELLVRDDGAGLPQREANSVFPSAHFGLRIIKRRIEQLGGRLTIESPEPRGLLLRATVPA